MCHKKLIQYILSITDCVLSIKNSKEEEKVVSFTKWPSKAADDQYYACNYKTGKVVRLGKGTCEFDSKTVEYEKTVSKNGTAYKCNYHIDEYKMVMSAYGKDPPLKFLQKQRYSFPLEKCAIVFLCTNVKYCKFNFVYFANYFF